MNWSRHLTVLILLLIFAVIMISIDLLIPFTFHGPAPEKVRAEVTRFAETLEGLPYGFGENGPEQFDCSGLIVFSYRESVKDTGYSLPFEDATSEELARQYSRPVSRPQPGDIAFFQNEKGRIIHAALILESAGSELSLLDAADYSLNVSVRSVNRNRSDLHSIARLILARTY
jgi:hypothetical protein